MRTVIIAGVAAVALTLTGCSDGADKPEAAAATDGGTPSSGAKDVDIKDFLFAPESATVAVGSTITWTNQDSAVHSVVSAEKGVFASNPTMEQGATFSFTADKAGTIDYICGIHNYMKGTIVVS